MIVADVVVAADFKYGAAVVFVLAFKFLVADFKFVVDADRPMQLIRNAIEQRNFISL